MACLLLALVFAGQALAQDAIPTTVREINAIPQDSIDAIIALGENVTAADIQSKIRSPFNGQQIEIVTVVLSDPKKSGLSSISSDGVNPSRIHFFVRDTSAVSMGPAGNDVQITDGDYQTTGSFNLIPGDVVKITANVSYFGSTLQLEPVSVEPLGAYGDFGIPDTILDPVTVTTADINENAGETLVRANWANFNNLNQQYVRIEDALVWRSPNRTDSRPNWAVTSDAAQSIIIIDDMSVRYRNDRVGAYPNGFDLRAEDYVAPAAGTRVNIQGFALLRSNFDPFNIGSPADAMLKIVPWYDEDVEVTAQPLVTGIDVSTPEGVPGNAPVTITADVDADMANVTSVTLTYTTSLSETPVEVAMTSTSDTTYAGDIPAVDDGTFVSYFVTVEASDGTEFESDPVQSYRVLYDGIDSIADIQATQDEGPGSSPFAGFTGDINITATVQTSPTVSGFWAIQESQDPWSGIVIEGTEDVVALDLQPGDVINVTAGTIVELRGPDRFDRSGDVTGIAMPTVTVVSTGGDPIAYIDVTTDVLQDPAVAEAHESMMLNFADVTVLNLNADGSAGDFGEWTISSDPEAADNEIRVDDQSMGIPSGFNSEVVTIWGNYAFTRGLWSETFGNYKLLPESPDDLGEVQNVAIDDDVLPNSFALGQNYPNPFNPVTTIKYSVPQAGHVTLEVFDLLGRQVRLLVDGAINAGEHAITFDAASLPSGMYLYRLTAGEEVSTRKMLLLK